MVNKMDTINVIYWTQSGNTLAMATAVAKGIEEAGKSANVVDVSSISAADLQDVAGFAIGCPAMGAEVLEETQMEPFMMELDSMISGKKVALFGSYGWGDGQWMRDWEDRVNAAGATLVNGEGVICQEAPDDDAQAECVALGKALAQSI